MSQGQKILSIIVIATAVLSIFIIILIFVFPQKDSSTTPEPGGSTPGQVNLPTVVIPTQMQKEKEAEENYAQERTDYLKQNPWITKLPIKSSSYFISFDPEKNTFLITVYAYKSQTLPLSGQYQKAKEQALAQLKTIGVNLNKYQVKFIEYQRE